MISGGIAPGWYPDYEAPPGHQRYWDGARWTERRASTPSQVPESDEQSTGVEQQVRQFGPWLLAAVAVLVLVSTAVLVIGDDQTGRADNSPDPSPPPASSTPGPPASEQNDADERPVGPRKWKVYEVEGNTVFLTAGPVVELIGVQKPSADCATQMTELLDQLVVDRGVILTRTGPDKNDVGQLRRYVEVDRTDVGLFLVQSGIARAKSGGYDRAAAYQLADAQSEDVC